MLRGQKPLVKTQQANRTEYTWIRLGYHKESGDASWAAPALRSHVVLIHS